MKALHDSYALINKGVPAVKARGRIFISKAVIPGADVELLYRKESYSSSARPGADWLQAARSGHRKWPPAVQAGQSGDLAQLPSH